MTSNREKKCILAYNSLLERFDLKDEFELVYLDSNANHAIREIDPCLFIHVFERLFNVKLPGIYRGIDSRGPSSSLVGSTSTAANVQIEKKIHNLQVVLDVLSEKIIQLPLDHIKARDLERREPEALMNFVEIFEILAEQTKLAQNSKSKDRNIGNKETLKDNAQRTGPPARRVSFQEKIEQIARGSANDPAVFLNIHPSVGGKDSSDSNNSGSILDELFFDASSEQATREEENADEESEFVVDQEKDFVEESYDLSFDAKGKGKAVISSSVTDANKNNAIIQEAKKKRHQIKGDSFKPVDRVKRNLALLESRKKLFGPKKAKTKTKATKESHRDIEPQIIATHSPSRIVPRLPPGFIKTVKPTPRTEAAKKRMELLVSKRQNMMNNPVFRLSSMYQDPPYLKRNKEGKGPEKTSRVLETLEKLYKKASETNKMSSNNTNSSENKKKETNDGETKKDINDPLARSKAFIQAVLPGVQVSNYLENMMRKNILLHSKIARNMTKREAILKQKRNKINDESSRLNQVSNIYKRDHDRYLELARRKSVNDAKRLQRIQYNERKRALVRMIKYNEEIQTAVNSRNQRKKAQEDTLVTKLVNSMQKLEFEALKDRRSAKKENEGELIQKLSNKREALENYYRDQCDMIKEEIVNVQKEQEIAEKDKINAIRQYYREQKGIAKRQIQILKDQLQTDQDDNYFRDLDIETIRREFAQEAKRLLGRY